MPWVRKCSASEAEKLQPSPGAMFFVMDTSQDAKNKPAPDHTHDGLDHIGFTVTGIDAVCAGLKGKGAVLTLEPTTIRPGVRIAFVKGPDNVSIELLERTKI